MSIRKILSCLIAILAMLLFSPEICLCSPSEITSILQLNNPRYRVGCDSGGPVLERVRDNLPDAENFTFNDLPSECLALTVGKIDALIGNEPEVISAMRNGLENVRLLTGYLGEPIPTAAGISDRSKIPGLKEKFNAFIAGLKADGTLSAMYKRWVYDNDTNMPVIDVPEKSDIHLTVGTTGITMPFSFFISNTVTGFDVELARRFAAHIGATVEFKIYSFGSILMALKSGAIDIALSNLYVTPETAKTVTFSDIIFTLKCIAIVRDDVKMPAIPEPETEKFSAFNGKRIGVFTGAVQDGMVKEIIPGAEILYFDALANVIGALVSGKIDAAAVDETIASEAERTNHSLTHMNELLGETHTAFLLPKSQKNNPLADEVNEYIRRIKSDGTLDEIRAIWFGDDDSKKIVPDYSKFPDTKGTIRIAADNETPIFSYIKDGKLTGYDVDIIVRFCMEKGYRPEISMINFTGVIPAVSSGKCDMGIGGISITPERAESVRFSEPVCSVKSLMLLKSPEQTLPSQKAGTPRRPKYSTFSDLDGKPIGVQTGVDEWATFAEKTFPHSKIVYYYTFTDIIAALNTHKIEAFFVDEPVYNLMATENKNLAKIDEKVDDSFNISYGFAKTEKGTKLCAEMSEYISRLQESGELAAIIAAWEGADESAKTIPNYKSFPANNGVLRLATEGEYPPFNYYRGKEIVGLDIDIAARFCEAYGYGLEVTAMMWDGIISAVISGKHDFACLVPTEAHGDDICFSTPYTQSRSIVACLKAEDSPSDTLALRLAGKKVGVQIGTTCAELVPARIPSAELAYYNSLTDSLAALRAGKIEAVCTSLPSAIFAENEDPTLERINPPLRETYLYPIFSRTDKARRLCEEYSDFLKTLWEDGTIDALNAKWLGADDSIKTVDDYSNLPAMNGTVMMAVDASIAPFAYVKANVIVGYDVDLAVMFCKSKGYGLVVENMPLTGVIASVKSGKSDFTQSMNKTEERAENTLFTSTPSIKSGNVLLTVKPNKPAKIQSLSDLAGKRIGTLAGTTHPEIAKEHIPSAEILQFNSMADILAALRAGKIDAVCTSDPIARFMMTEHDDIAYFGTQLTYVDVAPIFPKTEKGEKLRSQYSEFIRPLWNDGTIHRLESKWFSPDESKRVIEDYSSLPNNNGTLKMAVDLEIAPFVFMKDGKILGYDVDLAVRFCKAYGYGLEVMPMSFGAIIPAVLSGKCDFAASSIAHTKEREESVLFSFPNARTGNVILALKSELSGADTRPLSEFAGKNVGLMIGSDSAKAIEDKIPGVKLRFFDSPSYILPALRSGRIDAFYCSVPTAMNIIQNYNDLAYIPDYVSRTNHTAMFPDTDKGHKLCREYEDFLNVLWEDGTIDRLSAKWMNGGDESKQVTEDYSTLPAENGTLTLAVTEGLMPFVFYKNNRIQGYDIDLALMFCRAKGYGLNIEVMNHNGVLSSLKTGKCDFSYSVQWTEDRAMTVLFSSVPNAITGSILVVRKPAVNDANVNMKLSDFAGKKIGVVTGTNSEMITAEKIPSAKLIQYDSPADMLMALKQGKIDAISCGKPAAVFLIHANDGLACVSEPLRKNYRSAVFVSSDKGHNLRNEYGEFLQTLWDNGTIKKLSDKWIVDNDETAGGEDYSHLPSPKGTLKMAADVGMIPFVYIKDNKIIGYDVDLAVMFCKAKGYGLEFVPLSHSGVIASVASGKCDFSYALEYTEERAKSVLFSEVPNVESDNVLVVMRPKQSETHASPSVNNNELSFWDDVASSFSKTFIREDRWKLFAEGIMNTMIITVSAILCGMLLGFTAFMFCRTGSVVANVITKFSVWLIKGTPIVVLLMILYYIIFGHVNISGIIVSIIAFTLTFGTSVYRMLTFGTGAVDWGQTEAAYALGFTDMQTFFTVILPQAALHFMPSLREEVTMLIKSTSVVGYIAVQDLTKMGDIVRSRTYEAFFPLIAVAVIYFVLAGMLNIIVTAIEIRITPSGRKPEDILRGIDTSRGDENHD